MRPLVRAFGNGVRDAVFPQVVADATAAVPLVAQEMIGPGARSSRPKAPDLDLGEDLLELCAVVDVAAREDEAQRAAAAVTGEMDFGAQSAAGSSEGVSVCRFCWLCPLLRAPAAC